MFTVFKEYLAVAKFVILAVICIAVIVFYEGLPFLLDGRVDRARQAGAQQERILWEEARRKMIAQNEAARRAAQAEIDDIELKYLEQWQLAQTLDAEPEAAVHEIENGDGAGKPALSRRLSNVLNKIGR